MRTFALVSITVLLAISVSSDRLWAQNPSSRGDSSHVSSSATDYSDDATFARYLRLHPGMKPPKATYAPDPKFPDLPPDAEQRGTVVLLVGINGKGHVEAVRVLRSDEHAFETTAVDTVKKWKFRPAIEDGKPVPVQVSVEMKFER